MRVLAAALVLGLGGLESYWYIGRFLGVATVLRISAEFRLGSEKERALIDFCDYLGDSCSSRLGDFC